MRAKAACQTLFFLCILFLPPVGYAQQPGSPHKQVIHVKLQAHASSMLPASVLRATGSNYARTGQPRIDAVNARHRVVSMKRIFRPSGKYEYAHQRFGLDRWYEVTFESSSEAALIQDYRGIQEFEKVEHVAPYQHIGSKVEVSPLSTLPSPTSDPLFGTQWHYKNTGQSGGTPGADISLTQAWSIESGTDEVIVAVIDGGIDTAHPDLTGAMWVNEDEIPGNSLDDDGNGYIDDIYGYGFGDNTGTIYGDYHGTHVGGTIGAVTNNAVGVAGVAGGSGSGDGVRLMSCAGFGSVGVGGFEDAMVYAADNGAVISQNSWGGGSTAIEDAIDYFIARAGLDNTAANFDDNIQIGPMAGGLVIFAAGNSNSSSPSSGYPGSYEPVMAVASTDHNDVRSSFSNYGSWIEIAAPGSNVYSTYPVSLGSYATLSGTSMACPHVSGVAALIISKYGGPGIVPNQIWDRLTETADNIDAQNPSYIGQLGAGRLNAFHALQSDDGIPPAAIADLAVANEYVSSITLTWTAPGGSDMDGAASVYEIRYSTSVIDNTNFGAATLVTGVTIPLVAGSTETFEVTGLAPLTTYYFAIKSSDFFGNKSALSNVISGSTPPPPIIDVNPTALTENLLTGGLSTQSLNISNTGPSDLVWEITSEDFVSPTSAKVAYRLPANGIPAGPGNDGRNIEARTVETLNAALLDLDEVTIGYMLSYSTVLQSDLEARGATVQSLTFPFSSSTLLSIDVLAVDDLISQASSSDIALLRTWIENGGSLLLTADNSTSMTQVNALLTDTGITETSISFVDGIFSDIEVHPTTEDVTSVSASAYGSYCTLSAPATALIHESSTRVHAAVSSLGLGKVVAVGNEFAEDYHTGLSDNRLFANQVFDWLAAKSAWLVTPVSSGIIAAGTSEAIDVEFDATGLVGGTYSANLIITSNDPLNPELTIPVELHVAGAPDLSLTTTEIQFPDTFIGGAAEVELTLYNAGTDVLNVTAIGTSVPVFSTSASALNLDPGESGTIVVAFDPAASGAVAGELTITSNDPDEPTVVIDLSGTGIDPPVIEVTPSSIASSLLTGETEVHELTISNTGTTPLSWSAALLLPGGSTISVSSFAAPGPNNEGMTIPTPATERVFPMAFGDFTSRAASPVSLTSLAVDPASSFIYGQANGGTGFYRYDPAANSWTALQSAPESSGNNGGATVLNGKIYTSYTGHSQMGVYDISTNTWTTVTSPIATGNITSDGAFVYLLFGTNLQRYNPATNAWSTLASPSLSFTRWGALQFHNGFIYGQTGDGSSGFTRYQVSSNTWTTLTSAPGGMVLGGAIDPVDKVFYAYGSYNGTTLYAYNIENGTWSVRTIPTFSVNDGGLLYVAKSQRQGIYFTQGELGTGFARFETKPLVQWISIDPVVGTVAPGQVQTVDVTLDAHGLGSATYEGTLELTNNDPTQPVVEVPVTLTVTGAPDIRSSATAIPFASHFIGTSTIASVTLYNDGTDPLLITSIISSNASFTVGAFSPSIAPGQSSSVDLTFAPLAAGPLSGTLQIASNDPDENPLVISFTGTGVVPPVMSVSRAAITKAMELNVQSTEQIQLTNSGGSPLQWELEVTGSGGQTELSDLLTTLNADHAAVTGLIPSRYDFSGGESGYFIDDGGNDMFDGGNFLGTNLGSNLNYSNKVIASSATLGTGASYFTAKYPGLFVLAADVVNLSYLEINGNLGADGSGSADGTVLTTTKNGITFKGFVKRVYNAYDPSVNHLVIVRDQGSVNHSFSSDTNSDQHRISSLAGVNRIYYLLFAGTNGAYINNEAMRELMVAFLDLVDEGAPWLSISSSGGTLNASTNQNINLTFDTDELEVGDYSAVLTFTGNDPATPSLEVPVDLQVSVLVNDPPLAGPAISNKTVEVGDNIQINLAAYFTDPENQALSFTAEVANASVASHTLVGSLLTISGAVAGTSGVSITAKDPHLASATSSFTVTVVPANASPVVSTPLPSQVVEVGASLSFTLADIFSDPENDPLTFLAFSSVPTTGSASIESGLLKVNGLVTGATYITLYATDTHNQSATITFLVDVQPANLAPVVSKAFEGVTLEVGKQQTINLAAHFADPEALPLTYQVATDNDDLAGISLTGSLLELTALKEGTTTVTVTAKDLRLALVATTFSITVIAPNLPPDTLKPLEDVTLVVGESVTWSLNDYFSDPESAPLTYGIGFSTIGNVLGTLTEGTLTLKGVAVGETVLQLDVTDLKGLKIQSEVIVRVVAPDLAPVVTDGFDDILLVAGDPEVALDLSSHFSDPEAAALTYSLSFSGEKISTTLNGKMLGITAKAEGATEINVNAKDPGGNEVNATLMVNVRVNRAPAVAVPFAPLNMKVTDDPVVLNLEPGFIDFDNDPLTYTFTSAPTGVVTGTLNGATLRVTPVSVGTTELQVKASDTRGLFASQVITLTVAPITGLENSILADMSFPNPFSNELSIRYSVPSASHVHLVVYDQHGKVVATLVDAWKQDGVQTAHWDAHELAAGLYFYKLTIGHHQTVHKMIKVN